MIDKLNFGNLVPALNEVFFAFRNKIKNYFKNYEESK